MKEFESRRNRLIKQIESSSAVILFSAEENRLGGAPSYPYLQNSDFYYLTGFVEPESVAVLLPESDEGDFILFNRERDLERERWCGQYAGLEGGCRDFGADQAFPVSKIDEILPKLLSGRESIYSNVGLDDPRYQKIKRWMGESSYESHASGKILHKMRLRKSQRELEVIRKAAEITAEGHIRAMQRCKPGSYEYELKAELFYEFNRLGAGASAFEAIVASGVNACTLHYTKNNKKMEAGELVLVDAGIKHDYYCSDVTRTFPVGDKFTEEQRLVYGIVLEAQKKVIEEIKPGISWGQLQSTAEKVITEGLLDIGILKGNLDSLLEQKAFQPFFMHKIGHWLGIDVHDAGEYFEDDKSILLEPNMVFTVEPGIYISPYITNACDRWKGIGIRIEDNLLVTDNGFEVLSKKIPKDIVEVEFFRMGSGPDIIQ